MSVIWRGDACVDLGNFIREKYYSCWHDSKKWQGCLRYFRRLNPQTVELLVKLQKVIKILWVILCIIDIYFNNFYIIHDNNSDIYIFPYFISTISFFPIIGIFFVIAIVSSLCLYLCLWGTAKKMMNEMNKMDNSFFAHSDKRRRNTQEISRNYIIKHVLYTFLYIFLIYPISPVLFYLLIIVQYFVENYTWYSQLYEFQEKLYDISSMINRFRMNDEIISNISGININNNNYRNNICAYNEFSQSIGHHLVQILSHNQTAELSSCVEKKILKYLAFVIVCPTP